MSRRAALFTAAGALGFAIGDQQISAAVHAPGSWLSWPAVAFIAALCTFVGAMGLAVVGPLPRPHMFRELSLRFITGRKRRQPDYLRIRALERELGMVPPSALDERVAELGKMMRAASWSMSEAAPARQHLTTCTCAMCGDRTGDSGRCLPCERHWKAHR